MAFREIRSARGVPADQKSVAVTVRKDGNMVIRPGWENLDQLGWKVGDRCSIAVGADGDFGWLRIAQNEAGTFRLGRDNQKHSSECPRFAFRAATVDGAPDKLPSTKANFRIEDGAIYVRLPWIETPKDRQQKELDTALALAREQGAIVKLSAKPGLWSVDGKEMSSTALVDKYNRHLRVA